MASVKKRRPHKPETQKASDAHTHAHAPAGAASESLDRPASAASSPGHVLSGVPVRRASAADVDASGYEADDEGGARRLTPRERRELRKVPRRVTRTDATMDSAIGSYGASDGKPKAYRAPDRSLVPAGSGMAPDRSEITTTQHLLGRYPAKGDSSHISFTNAKRARELRDYSQAEKGVPAAAPPVTATLKARKLAAARLRGKADVRDTGLMTTKQILADVDAGSDERAKRTVTGYVLRDAEVHAVGRVPPRFVGYSDDPARPPESDGDSDSVPEEDTEYSD